jgi:hypothetical protein
VLPGLALPAGVTRADPMPIVGGSHDPLLEWALRESGAGLAILSEGSEAGLDRFLDGGVTAAAIHLHGLDPSQDANVDALRGRSGLQDAVLIAFARREQGILVPPATRWGCARSPTLPPGRQGLPSARAAPARNSSCSRCCARAACRWRRSRRARSVRPATTSRRRSARAAPIAASRAGRQQRPPDSISSLSCGSGYTKSPDA